MVLRNVDGPTGAYDTWCLRGWGAANCNFEDFNLSVIIPEGLALLYGSFWPRKPSSACSSSTTSTMVCIPFPSGRWWADR